VVHGALFWKLALAGFAALVLGVIAAIRGRRGRAIARRIAAGHAREVTSALNEGDVVLRGTFRGSPPSTQRLELRELADPPAWSWLEVSGLRVELEGERIVLLGSHVKWSRRIPRQFVGIGAPIQIASVHDGDEVIARGTLAARPPDSSGGYRDAGERWAMSGARLVAVRPAGIARPLRIRDLALTISVSVVFGYVALALIGRAALSHARSSPLSDPARPLVIGVDLQLAAAIPESRGDALLELHDEFDRHPYRDEASLRRWLAVEELIYGCEGAGRRLLSEERFEDALAWTDRCPDAGVRWNALVALGRYDDAMKVEWPSFMYPDSHRAGEVAIAAGRWADAAQDAVAYVFDPDNRSTCLAELFQIRAGKPGAGANLPELAAHGGPCQLIAAEALPPDQRGAVLERLPVPELYLILRDLLWASGQSADPAIYGDDAGSSRELSVAPNWLAPVALRAWASGGASPPDLAEARAWAAADAAIAGEPQADRVLNDPWQRPCPDAYVAALALARDGDGRPLALALHACVGYWATAQDLLAVLPHVTTGRDELARAVVWFRDTAAHDLSTSVAYAALRRDLCRAAGATDEAARWQAIVTSLSAPFLTDRDRAVALRLWETFSPAVKSF
jgi:hypothetical protein